MNEYAKLTLVDHTILESYKSMLDGLSDFIGPGYEIVLHSLENLDRSAIKVINGHYTGRKEGAPITDLALDMLSMIKKSGDNHKSMTYINRGKSGMPIRSTTIPICGSKDKLIGLLCINFYMDLPLSTYLDSMFKVTGDQKDIVETFASNTDELILSTLEAARAEVFNDSQILSANKNKEIITILFHKNIFNLKDAVVKVGEGLGISKNTVYLHLRNLQDQDK